MPSDTPRRTTQKLGRVRRDPRTDSVPPAAIEERISDSNLPPRLSGRPLPRISVPVASSQRPRAGLSLSELEAQLAKERAERAAEAGQIGQLLARATQAEARVKQLESLVEKLIEQRAELEGEVTRQRHSFAAQLMEQRQALEHLAAAAKPQRNKVTGKLESVASLTSVRTMATELLRLLERIDERENKSIRRPSEPTRKRSPSQPDTIPPARPRSNLPDTIPPARRATLPETLPPRARSETPPSSRRPDAPTRPPRS
jgi:hypothetical protein